MGFMVSIDGRNAPKYVHATADDAVVEAIRLQQENVAKFGWCPPIRILQEVIELPRVQNDGLMNIEKLRIVDRSVFIKAGTLIDLFTRCFRSHP
jgi:hypothetical protein